MARYPERGKEFLSDLLEPAPPALSPGQVETVCRILIDMPDIGNWHQSALQILPRYRATAERLLIQDREGGDIEKQYRAQMWLAQLRGEVPGPVDQLSAARRKAAVRPLPDDNSGPSLHPLGSAASPRRLWAVMPSPPPIGRLRLLWRWFQTPRPHNLRRPTRRTAARCRGRWNAQAALSRRTPSTSSAICRTRWSGE